VTELAFWRPRRLVRVHLDGKDFSIEGVLVRRAAGHYVLANASHIETAERTHALDGEVWLPERRVLYLQVIG
jgi:hypothetical protein